MVVVCRMIVVDFNANVERVGQVVDVIKARASLNYFLRDKRKKKKNLFLIISVSSYCAKYNPCVSIFDNEDERTENANSTFRS